MEHASSGGFAVGWFTLALINAGRAQSRMLAPDGEGSF